MTTNLVQNIDYQTNIPINTTYLAWHEIIDAPSKTSRWLQICKIYIDNTEAF
ncbi:uncharacterized protein SPAPADRAFT_59318 [Spathaspora passalidarum NRRL Y-27907]|uniref:Uncharacterized protein n=1 Tax=Spathaspora passalidarum (strain NRRL Y-27907 / 11-Y1) TaxID=619300 RepID=G3AJN3_SPAPN|nr:uncharacterized protein SPAPADRAFT_59318 [Spathaspora passalidarum NRRL Y-27907]EGW33934.1 hypothetical protein SPAPADRAFT_59318 [Spathaspora passalidarum NRRL Y-27907]